MKRSRFLIALSIALIASVASASWYDDYNDGLAAVRAGNWSAVVQKMTAAINAKAKEGNKERAYGTIFYNYHPYYYRGVANLQLGRYQQAITDLETTTGIGPENLGAIEQLIDMAKTKLGSSSAPPVVAEQPAPKPPVQQPVTPAIDAALRGRAQAALNQAKARVQAAQQRNAGSPQATQALQQFTDLNTRFANAKSNDDLEAVIAMTDNVTLLADSVVAPAAVATPITSTRPAAAAATVLADPSRRVRQALESYFAGEFDDAARAFEGLTRNMPTNGWIWAFLGAAQYSRYAFEADETYRDEAVAAFRKAKKLKKWQELPDRYFSRRIRKAYKETAG